LGANPPSLVTISKISCPREPGANLQVVEKAVPMALSLNVHTVASMAVLLMK
jgi:hypothetical protein